MERISLGVFLDNLIILDFYFNNGSPYDVPCKIKICSGHYLETTIDPEHSSCLLNYYNLRDDRALFNENITPEIITNKKCWYFKFDAEQFLKTQGASINKERNELYFKRRKSEQRYNTLPFHYLTPNGMYFGYDPYDLYRESTYGACCDGELITIKFFAQNLIIKGKRIKEIRWRTKSELAYTNNPTLERFLNKILGRRTKLDIDTFLSELKTLDAAPQKPVIITDDCRYSLAFNYYTWSPRELILNVDGQKYTVGNLSSKKPENHLELLFFFLALIKPNASAEDLKKYNYKAGILSRPILTVKSEETRMD